MKRGANSDDQQVHQHQQNEQSPLNSDGQQVHQHQQNEQSPLNRDGQQVHKHQQNEHATLNSDSQQVHQYQQKRKIISHFKSLNTKRPRDMQIEIQVLVWVGTNVLMATGI